MKGLNYSLNTEQNAREEKWTARTWKQFQDKNKTLSWKTIKAERRSTKGRNLKAFSVCDSERRQSDEWENDWHLNNRFGLDIKVGFRQLTPKFVSLVRVHRHVDVINKSRKPIRNEGLRVTSPQRDRPSIHFASYLARRPFFASAFYFSLS